MRHDVPDERASGRDDHPRRRRSLQHHGEKAEVEVVEVLVRHEQPVDALGREPERRRRDGAELVRARPGVDDDADPLELEAEPRLTEPRQSARRGRRDSPMVL